MDSHKQRETATGVLSHGRDASETLLWRPCDHAFAVLATEANGSGSCLTFNFLLAPTTSCLSLHHLHFQKLVNGNDVPSPSRCHWSITITTDTSSQPFNP